MTTVCELVPDAELRETLVTAIKQYAARAETDARGIALIDRDTLTATEAVLMICELMHASDLNPFDVAMWYRRDLPEVGREHAR